MNEPLPERRVFSVREFTAELDRLFVRRPGLANIAIRGEISGLGEFGNGHLKFTLKDQEAVLDCIAWSDRRRRFPELRNGASAIASGAIRVRTERSGYQLQVESIELVGLGELFLLYERLKGQFAAEGLFEPQRKRPVPELPRSVALVSARGKAMEDFQKTIARNVPFVRVIFIETRVQGMGAEIDIAAALDAASKQKADVIVLTRGGGSYEDLFPFNLEPVVRAIVRATVPVLTAIGHSGDHHLADDVADMSFGTPSLAAEHIAKGWILAARRLAVLERDLDRAIRDVVMRGTQRTDARGKELERFGLRILAAKRALLAERLNALERRNPQRLLSDVGARVARATGRLDTAIGRILAQKTARWTERIGVLNQSAVDLQARLSRRLERSVAELERYDPLSPLARGYAIVTKDGRALRDASEARPGDVVKARLERGSLVGRVESVISDE